MAFYRVTVQGHISTDEVWNFTWHLEHTTGDVTAVANNALEAVTLLWSGPPTPAASIQQLVPTSVGVDQVVADELNSASRNVAQAILASPLVGANTSDVLPYQVSVAVSTRTTKPTRAGRGRMFMPPYGVDTVVAGRLDSTARDQTAAAAAAMLSHIDGFASIGLVVYHHGTGTGDFIVSCDVGDVFDNQRRRRNQLTEERISVAVS